MSAPPRPGTPHERPFPPRGRRLPHLDVPVTALLTEEAAALDEEAHDRWLAMLDPAFRYEIPVPLLREDPALPRHSDRTVLFEATRRVLELKFGRTGQLQAWSDRPAATTRRFLGAVRVFDTPTQGLVRADTNLLVTRARGGTGTTLATAARQDLLRTADHAAGGWLLLHRRVLLDVEIPTHDQLSVVY